MYIYQHIILATIASLVLAPFIKWFSVIVFLSAILIDFDHYLFYLYTKKDFSLKNAYKSYIGKKELKLFIFHTIEFWTLLFLLSFITEFFLAILIGIFLHITQDLTEHIYNPKSLKYKPYSIVIYLRKP